MIATSALLLASLHAAAPGGTLAVRGGRLYTMAGAPIENGVVLVRDGKIAAVGAAAQVEVPSGIRTLEAAVVTPGLVDAHSVVGLAGYLNQPQDQDQLDETAAVQPELRAVDAYNATERLIEWIRGFGVTTVHTGHAPGALISGQTMIAKTRGDTVDEAVIVPEAMVAATLAASAIKGEDKTPGTRSKLVATLRQELVKAQEYERKLKESAEDKKPDRDLHLEALLPVLHGEVPLLVTADRHQEIVSALRVAKEFGLRVVLDSAAEAHVVMDDIRAAGVPVIVHPTMCRASGERENLSWETAAKLRAAGVPIALQSGYEGYVPKTRVVLFEAAIAAANGLGFDGALAAITIDAARILGVDSRVGSLEPGKDGDLALYDGDPFEYTTHCVGVVIEGNVVRDEAR
jgi:imidazolonepropionase-like amidohydrolase